MAGERSPLLMHVFVVVALLAALLAHCTQAQLSFSTGWGHGKRADPALDRDAANTLITNDSRAAGVFRYPPAAFCSTRFSQIRLLQIQQLLQDEIERQNACGRLSHQPDVANNNL
ncbi:uncharacterized protein LOC129601280 [Paramacrobiotus metropolitanus]|uniref:uncharacterized protein LOC129601280 n=1 Tax=Paramacrobiotus metropolitanus TaxID=2943436 RepID=UPI002445FEB7|nr:uncharacterized protein LOC129601280 [Paramacrobiotus metropolitanus]